MRHLNPLTTICLGVLLLTAPAAWGCELGEMCSPCHMPEMTGSLGGTSICSDGDQMSENCCDAGSSPGPMQAMSFESLKLLTALEATDLQVVAPLALTDLPPRVVSADGCGLHDLGRYTLFSSFLL